MKKSELQKIIKEELHNALNEVGKLKIGNDGYGSKDTEVYMDQGDLIIRHHRGGGIDTIVIEKNDIPALLQYLTKLPTTTSKQPQNELFGFGATKLKEGDKISMTVEPKAGFGAKGQIDKYEMEVIKTAINGVKVDFIERPETHTLVPEQGWLKSAEGKEGEKELKVGDFSRKQFGGTIKSIAVNGKETKGIKW